MLACQKFGFQDFQELEQYMKSKHYKWNIALNNYEKDMRICKVPLKENQQIDSSDAVEFQPPSQQSEEDDLLMQYLPLLKMLQHNEERLAELFTPNGKGKSIPRYTIERIAKTKTVQMIHTLSNMVTEFAEEQNISQRDIFEVALIDFFRKYGYETEVAQMFKTD